MKLLLSLMLILSFQFAFSQKSIEWVHYSTENGDMDVPNEGSQQTSCAVFDIDKNGINDFIITERVKAPSVVWYKRNAEKWDRYILDADLLRVEAGPTFYYVDNDSDLDPIFGGDSESNEVWWRENPYPDYGPKVP